MIVYVLVTHLEKGVMIHKATKNLKEVNKWLDESLGNDYYEFTV